MTQRENVTLITGAAGFVGFHLARHFHRAGFRVVGADNPERFTPCDIRRTRMENLLQEGITMECGDLSEQNFAEDVFMRWHPRLVLHMAARAGARCQNAAGFTDDNIAALFNVLSAAGKIPPEHFLFASSSSVYGETSPRPFREDASLSMPDNLYAASKLLGEQIAEFCAKCGNFPVTGIRFFNVYGPWGRTDMAPFCFADCLASGQAVKMISKDARRAWLYIDDAVRASVALVKTPPENGFQVVNVAGPELVRTMDVLQTIARLMKQHVRMTHSPAAFPEVTSNPADMALLQSLTGFVPQIKFEQGIKKFLEWHQKTSQVNFNDKCFFAESKMSGNSTRDSAKRRQTSGSAQKEIPVRAEGSLNKLNGAAQQ